jgi:hypothetical protein
MRETFREIESEISVRKVELRIKSKTRFNLFENEHDNLFSINSFVNAGDYWKHLIGISQKAKQKIEDDARLCQDMMSCLDVLQGHHDYLQDIRNSYLPENAEMILGAIQVDGLIKFRFDSGHSDILKKKHFIL